MILYTNVMKC